MELLEVYDAIWCSSRVTDELKRDAQEIYHDRNVSPAQKHDALSKMLRLAQRRESPK